MTCRKCKHELSQHIHCKFCGISVCAAEHCKCIRQTHRTYALLACVAGAGAAEAIDFHAQEYESERKRKGSEGRG